MEEGAVIYGLAQQAHYGDLQGERPNIMNMEAYLMWGWWNDQRGKSREAAIKEWLEFSIPVLEREGQPTEHSEKALIEKKYNECVKE